MIGLEIIEAQKRKKQYGSLFSYRGYQLLKTVETFRELNLIFQSWGFYNLKEEMTADEIYEEILKHFNQVFFDSSRIPEAIFYH